MPLYIARLSTLPQITPTAHTVYAAIQIPSTDPAHPDPIPVGTLTFQKDPTETWAQAAIRFRQDVATFIATYEQEQNLATQISAWLVTQTWTT